METLIVESLVGEAGYVQGRSEDFDRDHAVDLAKLLAFLEATQPKAFEALGLAADGPNGCCSPETLRPPGYEGRGLSYPKCRIYLELSMPEQVTQLTLPFHIHHFFHVFQ